MDFCHPLKVNQNIIYKFTFYACTTTKYCKKWKEIWRKEVCRSDSQPTRHVRKHENTLIESISQKTVPKLPQNGYTNTQGKRRVAKQQSVPEMNKFMNWEGICKKNKMNVLMDSCVKIMQRNFSIVSKLYFQQIILVHLLHNSSWIYMWLSWFYLSLFASKYDTYVQTWSGTKE